VHFSYLLEYVARGLEARVGRYIQISNDLHMYEHHWPLLDSKTTLEVDLYASSITHMPIFGASGHRKQFDNDILEWLQNPGELRPKHSAWIRCCLVPMYRAWKEYKAGYVNEAMYNLSLCDDAAWAEAARLWIARRVARAD
jgi:hypothetical protein